MIRSKLLLISLFILIFFSNCSNEDDSNATITNKSTAIRTADDRSFPIEDLLFPPHQDTLDYVNGIKDRVQTDNTYLLDLGNVLYFGELMWDAPKIIRNEDLNIVYTFLPVFDPTLYQVSHYFGIRDMDGTLTYRLESKNYIRSQIADNDLNHNVINSANIFEYFDYNFGFLVTPEYQDHSDGDFNGDTQELGILDCIQTTYIDDVLCTCGGSHNLSELDLCICKDKKEDGTLANSCKCPGETTSTMLDCWLEGTDTNGTDGPTHTDTGSGGSGGFGTTYSSLPLIRALQKYVDSSTSAYIWSLVNTPCEPFLLEYYAFVSTLPGNHPLVAKVNCMLQELSIGPDGECDVDVSPAIMDFDYMGIDVELIDWILNDAPPQLVNPTCAMITAGYTSAQISLYLSYLKISLNNEPGPGYSDVDGEPDPYAAWNIETDMFKANKVTQFLVDYPCVESTGYYGLMLSKPELVDWAVEFLDGDCGDESKTNYTNVVFNLMKVDSEFVPNRFSELYDLFTNTDDDILLSDCTYDITPWIDLASFVIPEEVNARLESLGWDNQDIDATGFWAMESKKVNLDYHSVTIDQLPDLDGDGVATPEELFDELRLNFPNYANGVLTVEITGPDYDVTTTWNFYENDYDNYWNTANPSKTILDIDTEASLPIFLTDDATVICSSFEEECCWVFSTVHANNSGNSNNGSHPVSGNRQFGMKSLGEGKYEFYIKAADRARISWSAVGMGFVFGGNNATDIFFQITDKAWDNLTKNVVNLINNPPSGGTAGFASQNTPITIRPIWSEVKDKLKSTFPLQIIPCDN